MLRKWRNQTASNRGKVFFTVGVDARKVNHRVSYIHTHINELQKTIGIIPLSRLC